mmetsp:Transcript_8954/g.29448  ORF Transcript_8954/g.29448 Transcript_8954/m.29448 type:complete len:460 (+) Transcript_8954:44-1423(+)|eukprot:CAMPEP_0170133916 /NCGR_PEP_ID=MMETSP0033_2-20121228/1608_1 /TAXON_ID=195969 /ORGANISM="Dolichomastix tenuilepis, Strain CCMP3274" /LENGTH=459 /DNA_ID=CAMNT_0010369451 /DNA_START=14 /DNA_END=1393 /DNA_ORIENTATION=+
MQRARTPTAALLPQAHARVGSRRRSGQPRQLSRAARKARGGDEKVAPDPAVARDVELLDLERQATFDLDEEVSTAGNFFAEDTKTAPYTSDDADLPVFNDDPGPLIMVSRPLPRVLILHTGGTLGMDPQASFQDDEGEVTLVQGGTYSDGLQPGKMLTDLTETIPELRTFANLDVRVCFNKDSCRVTPNDWVRIAKTVHAARSYFDAFILVHGTDTLAYTASALSLMLAGFRKPIIITGSQLPLLMPRSDARQNLIDSMTCATAGFSPPYVHLEEVAVCFGGKLLRGNRCRKMNTSQYAAFASPSFPVLANLGVDVAWNEQALLRSQGVYRPRFNLNANVMRIPIVPGCDPRIAYGDLYERGVRGIVLEAFGCGNLPDLPELGWMPWLRAQLAQGMAVYLASQCGEGDLRPELYRSGSLAIELGAEGGPQMTPECAVVKMMLCLEYPTIPLAQPIAGEL